MCNHDEQNHSNNRKGTSLKNKKAHSEDHKNWSRRGFLHTLGLAGSAGMFLGGYSLSAMNSPSLVSSLMMGGEGERILVLIRLKGGNDGLNMIVPLFDYGTYASGRPNIAIPESQLINLNSAHAIPNSMEELMPLWNDGAMKVVNSVGYDNHNLSHFTSSDIWNSANPNVESDIDQSGWLGRYILNCNPDYLENLPEVPGAIKISSGSNIAFHNADRIDLAVNFNTPDRLISIAETGNIYDTENLPDDCYYGDQVGFLRSIMNVTTNYAKPISEAYGKAENAVSYGNNELARQLSIVARLIKGNLGTRLYMVTLDGFDTHENQNQKHPQLMNAISSAVSAFYQDLASDNRDHDVLSMTFSEFGRRIKENAGGTDHGTAAPIMMFGPALNGNGVLGDNPDMQDVDGSGNLKHTTDFRSIYATILEQWLCLDPAGVDEILGQPYERLDNLGLNCMSVSTDYIPLAQGIKHFARPDGNGSTIIEYELDRPGNIDVSVYSVLGQKIATLERGYKLQGPHQSRFINHMVSLYTFPMVYKIEANGKVYSGKFIVNN